MRVLLWAESFWPYIGGVGLAAARVVDALQQRGYEFSVVTPHDFLDLPNDDFYRGTPVHRHALLSVLHRRDVAELHRIRQQLAALKRQFAPHLVHVKALGLHSLLHMQTAAAHPTPVLLSLHQNTREGVERNDTIDGRMLRSADWVTCCSRHLLDELHARVPEIRSHSSVIYNGAEPSRAPDLAGGDRKQLLLLGRLTAAKGFDIGLTAFAKLAKRHHDLRLVVAGDGEERASLEQQAHALGIAGAVDFLGWVDPAKTPELISSSIAVVMPSRREGLPNAALEAGHLAVPVVGARVGGLPEVVVEGRTGLLVPPEDADALESALSSLLDQPARARSLGRAARERARSLFDLKTCVDAHDALYQQLIADASVAAAH